MEEQLLIAKVNDALRLRDTTGTFKAVGFLTAEEASFVASLKTLQNQKYAFYGGFQYAERVYFVAMPDWCDNAEDIAPIEAFTFTYRKCDKLSHRDFLGTLMSLGITRESVGDILCEEGRTVVFASSNVSEYILSQIGKVGGVGVQIKKGYIEPLPNFSQLKEFCTTIASFRLDCVVAALLNTSREKAKELINEKIVSVDGLINEKTTFCPKENSKISVKGVGKFILCQASEQTKKGRIKLVYKKYV